MTFPWTLNDVTVVFAHAIGLLLRLNWCHHPCRDAVDAVMEVFENFVCQRFLVSRDITQSDYFLSGDATIGRTVKTGRF